MLNLSSDPYYDMDINVHVVSPIKFSEMVDSSVFIHPCTFFLIQDSVRERSKGEEDQRGEAALGKTQKRRRRNSLSVRVL